MKKIGLFYAAKAEKTSWVAERIQKEFGESHIKVVPIEQAWQNDFAAYDCFIVGASTWFDGELPTYWDELLPELRTMDLKGKKATLKGIVTKEDIENLKNGVEIDDGYITKPAKAKILKIDEEKKISRVQITIHEGKNRQVRKMCESIGKKVLALHRCRTGNLDVKDLKLGEWRYLSKKEVENF